MGLFNFKKEEKLVNESASNNQQNDQEQTVTDVMFHNEVYSAGKLLLQEYERIINAACAFDEENVERLSQLEKLGFGSCVVDQRNNTKISSLNQNIIKRDLMLHYKHTYPNNKFIDEETVKKICEKYGFLLTGADRLVDAIPVKNQKEIINFRVFKEDLDLCKIHSNFWRPGWSTEAYMEEFNNYPNPVNGLVFEVIAPVNKLNTYGMEINGYRLVSKDPIVLQPVKGGYLIVTSWGIEASDPDVVNEKHN